MGTKTELLEFVAVSCLAMSIGIFAVWFAYAMLLAINNIFNIIKDMTLNQKRKICLWIGTIVMDVAIGAILYDRVVGRYGLKWSAMDAILLMALIIITTAVIFYSLSSTKEKPKDEQKQ